MSHFFIKNDFSLFPWASSSQSLIRVRGVTQDENKTVDFRNLLGIYHNNFINISSYIIFIIPNVGEEPLYSLDLVLFSRVPR